MRLKDITKGIKIIKTSVKEDTKIEFIASDHRKVKDNTCFVALKGTKRDGNDYIYEAIKQGATVIFTEDANVCNEKIPYVLVENTREALAKLWASYYGNPSQGIITVAITGTNGKTSSAYFLYSILQEAKIPCGLISTVDVMINGERVDIKNECAVCDLCPAMTTPDPEILYLIYNKMKEKGVKVAVIEASSHALEQHRLDGINIDIGAFSNLTSEHLDYHGNMEDYFCAKEKLLKMCKKGIINIDDEYGKRLYETYKHKSASTSVLASGDICAKNVTVSAQGCEYEAVLEGGLAKISSAIPGKFTVYNSLLALACGVALGINKESIIAGIRNLTKIKGRMERYKNYPIYIDYAHTPYATESIIKAVKEIEKDKKIIVLFGCGGDRDRSKRAEMGKICSNLADFTIVTADNPRTEKLNDILADIVKGVDKNKSFAVIPNRKDAIKAAVKYMNDKYALLLLGKGHEEYEIIGQEKRHFSEWEILDEVLKSD